MLWYERYENNICVLHEFTHFSLMRRYFSDPFPWNAQTLFLGMFPISPVQPVGLCRYYNVFETFILTNHVWKARLSLISSSGVQTSPLRLHVSDYIQSAPPHQPSSETGRSFVRAKRYELANEIAEWVEVVNLKVLHGKQKIGCFSFHY